MPKTRVFASSFMLAASFAACTSRPSSQSLPQVCKTLSECTARIIEVPQVPSQIDPRATTECVQRKNINVGRGFAFVTPVCSTKTAAQVAADFLPSEFFKQFCEQRLDCRGRSCETETGPADIPCVVKMTEFPDDHITCREVDDSLADCLTEGEKKYECTVFLVQGRLRCGCECDTFL